MVRWAMGASLLEHRLNEIMMIAMVMRRRRLEWFGHVKRRGETENIRAVVKMKMERKRPRERPKLRWKDRILSGGTLKPGTSGRNGPLTGNDGKVSARPEKNTGDTYVDPVLSCPITSVSVDRLLFIAPASASLWPLTADCFTFSLPARSTKFCKHTQYYYYFIVLHSLSGVYPD